MSALLITLALTLYVGWCVVSFKMIVKTRIPRRTGDFWYHRVDLHNEDE